MKYYYIADIQAVAKADERTGDHFLYDVDKGWVKDEWSIVMDYIVGWDNTIDEPPGSPFAGFGHISKMQYLREISEIEMQNLVSSTSYQYSLEGH